MKESEVLTHIRHRLDNYKLSGIIEWWSRLNSGNIRIGNNYIRMCKPGTPDFLALFRGKTKTLKALFIEVKSSIGKLRSEQKYFYIAHHNGLDIFVLLVRDMKEIDNFFDQYGYEPLDEWKI